MKFAPKTQKEIDSRGLIPAGFYNYEVLEANEKNSLAGNPLISLKLRVSDDAGRDRFVFDNLMEAFDKKLHSFCHSHSFSEEYENGELTDGMCRGLSGRLELVIKPTYTDKNGKEWQAKNEVKDYILLDKKDDLLNDVPF